MNITFTSAKNGQINAQYNNINFHSAYNPDMEAKRYTDAVECSFNPQYVLITEPALSYCIPYLKEKYPKSSFICVRYTDSFTEYNSNFDIVLNFFEHKNDFENYFFNYFGEEKIFQILFLKWDASSKAFPQDDATVWNSIKNSLQKAKTLLVTREYFEKKWFLNSINFFNYAKNLVLPNKTQKPILIIASGPSLKPLLKELKSLQNQFFIICLSSAISVLKSYNIKPDLYLSTDGGYWAGQHLKSLHKIKDIPLALPSEAFCPKEILQSLQIIPLNYGDGISSKLFNELNNKFFYAERNGTVSGTALKLAISLTDKEIYFAGLDLFASKKASHTEPNEIEINNSIKDFKLSNKEKRITRGGLGNQSLDIYKDWFSNFNPEKRKIYRIINDDIKFNTLGQINDITVNDFYTISQKYNTIDNENIFSETFNCNNSDIAKVVNSIFKSTDLLKQLFPLDYASLLHNPSDEDLINKIETKKNELQNKVKRILNDL